MAGLSFEQLSAIIAKTVESTRQEGSQVGNSLKTIITRLSKVGELTDEVDNETLSKASASLHQIGIEVYNADGSYRQFDVIMGELANKWNDLTDAERANLSYNIAATRQTNTLQAILKNFAQSMDLATEATEANGNALANQEKYNDSYNGQLQSIRTQMDEFWLSFWNTDATHNALAGIDSLVQGLNTLADNTHPLVALAAAIGGVLTAITLLKVGAGKIGGRAKRSFATIRKLISKLRSLQNILYKR